jgi:5-methylcytosine-specific restriction endonuclease McrA
VARERESRKRFDAKRQNSSQRGYNREWEKEAKAFLARPENRTCARCGDPATVVMHIRSIRRAPHLRMEPSNWRPGCKRCNALDAARERRAQKGNRS